MPLAAERLGAAPAPRARERLVRHALRERAQRAERARVARVARGIGPQVVEDVHAQPLARVGGDDRGERRHLLRDRAHGPGHDDGEPARPARRLAQPRVARHGRAPRGRARAARHQREPERKRDGGQVHTTWVTESGMCLTKKPSHAPPLRSGGRGEAGSYPDVTEFLPAGRFFGVHALFWTHAIPEMAQTVNPGAGMRYFPQYNGSSRRRCCTARRSRTSGSRSPATTR